VSYADFITLLFAFFVVLYAFAKQDQKKQTQISVAIESAFQSLGIFNTARKPYLDPASRHDANGSTAMQMSDEVRSLARVQSDFAEIRHQLQQTLSDQIARGAVSIEMGPDGLVISLREAGFFDSGSADPRPGTVETLRAIAKSIAQTPHNVRVEGHTDNVPVHNAAFDSNWELSSARATRITRLLLDLGAVAPPRLSAAGYAEFHPVADNRTAEGRAENRRVDLVVMPRVALNLPGPPQGTPAKDWHKISEE
jgi:chemotaxis protein MotB